LKNKRKEGKPGQVIWTKKSLKTGLESGGTAYCTAAPGAYTAGKLADVDRALFDIAGRT